MRHDSDARQLSVILPPAACRLPPAACRLPPAACRRQCPPTPPPYVALVRNPLHQVL